MSDWHYHHNERILEDIYIAEERLEHLKKLKKIEEAKEIARYVIHDRVGSMDLEEVKEELHKTGVYGPGQVEMIINMVKSFRVELPYESFGTFLGGENK